MDAAQNTVKPSTVVNRERGTRQDYLRRYSQTLIERSSWFSHWQDLAQNLAPSRGRFVATDRNRGYKRDGQIINNVPVLAVRTLAAGMMSGITSPARIWFRMTTSDPDLAEVQSVKEWLELVETRIFEVFAKSNLYNSLQLGYTDLGVFGTHVALVEEDERDVIRLYCPPVGRYCLANGERMEPDTIFREDSLTVAQLVDQFGLDACSPLVQTQYKAGNYQSWIDILHVIEPNRDRIHGAADKSGKSWKSVWFERGANAASPNTAENSGPGISNKFLFEGGFEEFPVLAPRWTTTGTDVYGSSPGMDVLGDSRALQQYEKRAAQLVDKIVNPPMVASVEARNSRLSLLPGDVSYLPSVQGGRPFQPAIEVNPQAVSVVREAIRDNERRINDGMFANLFLMLANEQDPTDKTAREIAERHEEKLTALGPVLERVHAEYLAPLVNRTFRIMARQGRIPPAPPELRGKGYKVEFISVLAQAQKLLGVTSNDRAWQFAMGMSAGRPEVLDVIDADKMLEDQFDRLGTSPKLLLGADKVAKIRQARAKQQAQQQQAQMAMAATQGAKNLAQAPTDGKNALTDLASQMGPGAEAALGGN